MHDPPVAARPGCGIRHATLAGSDPADQGAAVAEGFLFEGETDRRLVIRG